MDATAPGVYPRSLGLWLLENSEWICWKKRVSLIMESPTNKVVGAQRGRGESGRWLSWEYSAWSGSTLCDRGDEPCGGAAISDRTEGFPIGSPRGRPELCRSTASFRILCREEVIAHDKSHQPYFLNMCFACSLEPVPYLQPDSLISIITYLVQILDVSLKFPKMFHLVLIWNDIFVDRRK